MHEGAVPRPFVGADEDAAAGEHDLREHRHGEQPSRGGEDAPRDVHARRHRYFRSPTLISSSSGIVHGVFRPAFASRVCATVAVVTGSDWLPKLARM